MRKENNDPLEEAFSHFETHPSVVNIKRKISMKVVVLEKLNEIRLLNLSKAEI